MPSLLRPVRNFDEAVAALGGTNKAARAIGKRPSQICQWRKRDRAFPADLYFVVSDALEVEGYAAPAGIFTFERARAG